MPHRKTPPATAGHTHAAGKAYELLTAVSMTVGRGPAARTIGELAQLSPGDQVVDIGCGPGTAARVGARRCAHVTGVDPATAMLRLGRWLTAIRGVPNVAFLKGTAETLPLPDTSATVAWALSSVHHWTDRGAGLTEAARVLAPGGRILLAERLAQPGARGHAAHGLTRDQADQLAADLTAAGFTNVRCDIRQAGRRTLIVVRGSQPQRR
jgi:ubiquinone/menaquinone biosynthesis C-methylase UbiE